MSAAKAVGAVHALGGVKLGGVLMLAPLKWPLVVPSEAEYVWTAPDGQSAISLVVMAMTPPRLGADVVDEAVERLGTKGFETMKLGAHPAAKKTTTDFVGSAVKGNEVLTTVVVGSNGRVRFGLTATWSKKTAALYAPILKRCIESVGYAPRGER